jgi:hypothetical protein
MSPCARRLSKPVLILFALIILAGALIVWIKEHPETKSESELILAPPGAPRVFVEAGKIGTVVSIQEVSVKIEVPPVKAEEVGPSETMTPPLPAAPEPVAPALVGRLKSPVLPGHEEFLRERSDLVSELDATLKRLAPLPEAERLAGLSVWRADNAVRLKQNREKAVLYKERCIDDFAALISR